jgi:molybdopterin-guanine dinucleotide biosynthesis protein A
MFDAVVLAGGAARRLAGADKPGLEVGGLSLLERVLAAVAGAGELIVVGPPRVTTRPVRWVREEPPGGGPVAAIAAAVPALRADRTVLLAADLPHVAPAVPALLRALDTEPGAGAACLIGSDGRVNYLAAAWRTQALRIALAAVGRTDGVPVRRLLDLTGMIEVPDPAGWGLDCDTWEQLAAARRRAQP